MSQKTKRQPYSCLAQTSSRKSELRNEDETFLRRHIGISASEIHMTTYIHQSNFI